ncbi:MAG: cytochrome c maturation protein CcmE [Chloroflexi bacterium]|nr:cytochrome c maturation protein CcmE [Chloroflexota bacterium]
MKPRRKSRRIFLVGGVLIVVAFGSLLFSAFGKFGSYSLTVTQFKDMQASLGMSVSDFKQALANTDQQEIKVHGWVAKLDTSGPYAKPSGFTVTDGKTDLPIVYSGKMSSMISQGTEVVIQGKKENGALSVKQVKIPDAVRIEGPIFKDVDVTYDVATRTTRFTITDEKDTAGPKQNLAVVYTGPMPDTFFADVKRGDVSMVVVGRMGPDGVFAATEVLSKCASKYEPATSTPKVN